MYVMHLMVVISLLSMRIFLHSTSQGSRREFLSQAFVRIIISLIQCSLAFREGYPQWDPDRGWWVGAWDLGRAVGRRQVAWG